MATGPQIAELVALQMSQLKTMGAIRARAVEVLKRYLDVDILMVNDHWLDVNNRLAKLDQTVRRATKARQEDE